MLALVARYQVELLKVQEFGDESETIVTAKMMAAGHRLYSEIFNHHGPLTFFPGWLLEQFGSFGVSVHRLPQAGLQWLVLIALASSPLLSRSDYRPIVIALVAAFMVLFLPDIFGQMGMYQNYAGCLFAIALALWVLPVACGTSGLPRWRVAVGCLALAALPFLAFTYTPAAVLLFVAALRRENWRAASGWLAFGIALQLLWLAAIGSLSGFVAFHLYMNLVILPNYVNVAMPQPLLAAYDAVLADRRSVVLLIALVAALAVMASRAKWALGWRAIAIGAALGSLLVRGDNFHGVTFYYAALAMPLLFVPAASRLDWKNAPVWLGLMTLLIVKLSLLLPSDRAKLGPLIPKNTEFARLVARATEPADRILAYSFVPYYYIDADRLPASGHFFFSPWQAEYNRQPVLGVSIDACEDIKRNRPKVVLADRGDFWGRYPWLSFAGCLDEVLRAEYRQLDNPAFFVRRDIDLDEIGLTPADTPVTLEPSSRLAPNSPLALAFEPSWRDGRRVSSIKIRMATYTEKLDGVVELVARSGESVDRIPIRLDHVRDNEYFSVELPHFVLDESAQLVLESGRAVSLSSWEVVSATQRLSCVVLSFEDGSERLTPGCPLPN
ncbi:hypothetical protein [Pseudomarimonas arenosa]|uniref:Glycosyltransferase RgtA/B/C/D-like domain-containing protein n=1 Tax=Pseudomarimonas arenosa TaxID=2774145 RepID=A0AAW3ZFF1_9GAMM|nr:hypothetical protein [Pseudomarimonas arenosa]MBD8524883.1 hypothetical protein [Pseudomarimonas arenosa]